VTTRATGATIALAGRAERFLIDSCAGFLDVQYRGVKALLVSASAEMAVADDP
jgi:hypothetical protein